ncbi:MAG: 7-carboxy-7-deazaguanine synthase QueE [Rickettsiales bacterium]
MFGRNPKRKPIVKYNGSLFLKEIVATFQGEGPFVGRPAIFIRLGGCNLSCEFCDTDFEDFLSAKTSNILLEVEEKSVCKGKKINLVVITGGEPLRQPIEDLCDQLLDLGYEVQIETNGTLHRKLNKKVHIVCSPKVVNKEYLKIHPLLLPNVTAFKFLVSTKVEGYNDIPSYAKSFNQDMVYLQPMDEIDESKNRENMLHTLRLANKYGFNLCLQTHKIWGIY